MVGGAAHFKPVDIGAGSSVYQIIECGTRQGICKSMLDANGDADLFTGAEAGKPGSDGTFFARDERTATKESLALAKFANKEIQPALVKIRARMLKNVPAGVDQSTLGLYLITNQHGTRPVLGTAGPKRHAYHSYPLWLLIIRHLLMPWRRD